MSGGDVEARVRLWLQDAVVGLDLCPFAAPVVRRGQVAVEVSGATDPVSAVHDALTAASALLEAPPDEVATTLVVYPDALADFDTFLDALETLDALLAEAGAEGLLQLAHFHPDYRFEGAGAEDLENYTNRAPVPVVHLLRADMVEEAVQRHPDPEGIPALNVARLESLGREAIEAMWARWQGGPS